MDYMFCARSISRNAFTDEPGASQFLEIPGDAGTPTPDHKIPKSAWLKKVREAAVSGRGTRGESTGDIVFYVHGFNNSPQTVLSRQRKIRKGLEAQGFDGVVVSFDWPSADLALNYLEDRVDAKQTAFRLVDEGIATFAKMQGPDCRINLHLLAHSTGCYVVREAFDDADDRPGVAAHSWSVSQVIFAGADISDSSLAEGNPKSSSLYRHCARLTNYYNPFDGVLSVSSVKRIGVAPRAGRIGLPAQAPDKAVDVYCGEYWSKHKGDFDGGLNAAHCWYFDDPMLLEDVYHTIQGEIDRHEFPTRLRGVTDRGSLVLKP